MPGVEKRHAGDTDRNRAERRKGERLVVEQEMTEDERERFRLDGWRIGAGLQQSIGTNTYAKLEYRYSNYEKADYRFVDGGSTEQFDVDTDRHQIVAGVGVRF